MEPPQFEPLSSQFEPFTFGRRDDHGQGGLPWEQNDPGMEPVDPLADIERGLASVGVDSGQIEDDFGGFEPILDPDPPEVNEALFGDAGSESWFDASPLLPDGPADPEPEPLFPGFDERDNDWPPPEFRF